MNNEKKEERKKRLRIYRLKYRNKNKKYYADYQKKNLAERRALIDALKSKPCMDCGGSFQPVCMDFDHRQGTAKVDGVSKLILCSLERLQEEIAKCDLVCSNCHRIRTKNRPYTNRRRTK